MPRKGILRYVYKLNTIFHSIKLSVGKKPRFGHEMRPNLERLKNTASLAVTIMCSIFSIFKMSKNKQTNQQT